MNSFLSMPAMFAFGVGVFVGVPLARAVADPLTVFESASPFGTTGFSPLRLGGATLGSGSAYVYKNDSVSFSGVSAEDGVVRGSSPGAYAAPVTDAAGDLFGGKYLSTGNTGDINIAFATPQHSLSLLWGSIDASNEITFLNGNQVVGVVDGAEIDPSAIGFQGIGGSAYVLIDSAVSFDDIEISSGTPSFELAAIRSSTAEIPVHEPSSIALLGGFLLGFVGIRRRVGAAHT
jgi:hypothetical protein